MTAIVHPEFAARGHFRDMKLGRSPVKHDSRTLMLADYLVEADLPAVPDSYDNTTNVSDWPMYDNNKLGNCTCAAAGHMVQAWTAAFSAANEVTPAVGDVDLMYWETGDPPATTGEAGGPTDTGRAEIDVLNYWRGTGLGGDKISAYVSIEPHNLDHIRLAMYLFGGVYTGVALPITAQSQSEWDVVGDGKTGDSAPGSWGGHAIPYFAYDKDTFTCGTWGALLKLTVDFHDDYNEEVYAIISRDFLNQSGMTPAGINIDALNSDLHALGH